MISEVCGTLFTSEAPHLRFGRLDLPEQREERLRMLNGMGLKAIQECHRVLPRLGRLLFDGLSRLVGQIPKLSIETLECATEILEYGGREHKFQRGSTVPVEIMASAVRLGMKK